MSKLKTNFSVREKHSAFFTGGKVQVSKDGQYTFCQCGTQVQALEVASGQITHTIAQEDDVEVTSFVLSPDQQSLIVAYRNLLFRQWRWRENKVTRTWKAIHTAPVACMEMDQTSTLLASGGADATIKVWDVIKQYCTHNLRGHQGVISVVAFHPDSSLLQLLTAANDYNIRIWQLETSNCLALLEGHYSTITSLIFSPDAEHLYSCGRDKIIMVWDLQKHKKEKTVAVYESLEGAVLLPAKEGHYTSLNVTSPQPHLITGGSKGVLQIWNVTTGSSVYTKACVSSNSSKDDDNEDSKSIVSVSLVDDVVTVVTYDHNILQYSLDDLHLNRQYAGYNDDILDMKFFSANDSHLAVATNSERLKVFDANTWSCQILHGHTDTVMCLDVSHQRNLLLSGSKDKSVRVWQNDPDTGGLVCVAVATGHTHSVLAAAFSRLDGSFIVSGSEDLTLKSWRLPKLSLDSVTSLTARVTEKAHEKDINSVAVSPNDKLIATGSQDRTAKLWRGSDLALLGVFRGHKRGIWCVQFSPVDQCLATASADTTIKIWALSDFSCVKTFEGHESSVLRLSFVSQGMQLVSCGSDGLLKLWTIKNNECVKTLDAHEDKVWALAVTQTEHTLVTGAGDSNIIMWKDVTEEEVTEARAKKEDLLLKEQELQNLLQQKKYLKAISLAITLEQPFRLLSIFKEILGEANVEKEELQTTLTKLRDDQLDAVLRFVSTWNTNSRHCHEAQCVLSVLLTTLPPETILSLPNARSSLQALLPYTERHFQRMNRLFESSMFVDYTWQNMRLAEPTPVLLPDDKDTVNDTSVISDKLPEDTAGSRLGFDKAEDKSASDKENDRVISPEGKLSAVVKGTDRKRSKAPTADSVKKSKKRKVKPLSK